MVERIPNEKRSHPPLPLKNWLRVRSLCSAKESIQVSLYTRACAYTMASSGTASTTTAEKSNGTAAETLSTTAIANRCLQGAAGLGLLVFLYYILVEAYEIRLYAIKEYGRVIHEFDPYFNYRATEVRLSRVCIGEKDDC
jgi:hypothetical protein